jgi:hypothetical protein
LSDCQKTGPSFVCLKYPAPTALGGTSGIKLFLLRQSTLMKLENKNKPYQDRAQKEPA